MKTKISTLIVLILIIQSCGFSTTPENYFEYTTVYTNLFSDFGSKDFQNFRTLIKQNALIIENENGEWVTQDKLVPHIETYVISNIEKNINKIQGLKKTASTDAMIEASLNLHEFTLEIYQKEYLHIANLIDCNASESIVNDAISELDKHHLEKYLELYTKLMDVALPYAEANKIKG
ncbi:hypothetical protein [uncultured Winogradskyella sp.]|uniref:hypothetical protein n=1 Tax=Winogradskyella sp. 4-2091 TaxID=3381659 RepID=UPI002609FF74|nr:hypothetical protein [uncultured Winogradskyella sp.]